MIQASYRTPHIPQSSAAGSSAIASAYDLTRQMFGELKGKSVKQTVPSAKLNQFVLSPSTSKSEIQRTAHAISLEKTRDKLQQQLSVLKARSHRLKRGDEFNSLQQEIKALQERLATLRLSSQENGNLTNYSSQEQLLATIKALEQEKAILQTKIKEQQLQSPNPNPDFEIQSKLSQENALLRQEIAELQQAVENGKARYKAFTTPLKTPLPAEQKAALLQRIAELEMQKKGLESIHLSKPLEKPLAPLHNDHNVDDLVHAQDLYSEAQEHEFQQTTLNKKHENHHAVLKDQLAVLEETIGSLVRKQEYCLDEIKKYNEAVKAKKRESAEIKAAYQERQDAVNQLVKKKQTELNLFLTQTKTASNTHLNDIKKAFKAQRKVLKSAFTKKIAEVQEVNQTALTEFTAAMNAYCKELQNANTKHQTTKEAIVKDYGSYVNDGIFNIRNVCLNEYLYAADYEPFDEDRRRVFTWKKHEVVKQGPWRLIQKDRGLFAIYNTYQNEYLYAAEYAPVSKCVRRVFTWRPGTFVDGKGLWKLVPTKSGEYYLFNTYFNEYMYAAASYDNDRREVFSASNVRSLCQWRFEKIN